MTRVLREIQRILWEEWDPIGVNDIAPDDEYDSYASRIFAMLGEGGSELEIAEYLRWAAIENMGLGGSGRDDRIAEGARLIARRIAVIREENQ